MSTNFFYTELGFEQLIDCAQIAVSYPEYQGLEKIGADKVYFSDDFPAVLFKEVRSFNAHELREIAEIQRKVWNYRKVMFLFVMSETEIRIYNCYEKPNYLKPEANVDAALEPYEIFKTQKDDMARLEILKELFSRIGVDCGLIWTSEHNDIRERIKIQKRIDRYLVQSLLETAEFLNKDIGNKEIVHGLLMRSLFILYLEDKGAEKETGLYSKVKEGAKSYFDILDDVDATYRLFDELRRHFNGNAFPVLKNERYFISKEHLQKIKNCFIDGNISIDPKLFDGWRVFDFNFIQIELLSEVYENFLGEFKDQKERGQFYTPYSLVELMLNEKLPTTSKETDCNIKILDIACSSGIFLVESYKRLIRRWKNANPNKPVSFKVLRNILVNNIFGIEIDPLAIRIAAFCLYLALVEHLDPKTLWIKKEYRLPYLINDPVDRSMKNRQGKNLWCRDTVGEINAKYFEKVDLVVGNPPSGTEKIGLSVKYYLNKRKYAHEQALAFLDKAVQFTKNEGKIALIFNTKVLTNTNKSYQKFRQWLFNKTYVEKVYNLSIFRKANKDFGGQLFNSATIPVSIVYYQKELPQNVSDTVEYYAPQTYVKSNIIDSLVIDNTDIKFLSRIECQKPDTKIWKIAMWGTGKDFNLISSLNSKFSLDLKSYFRQNNWIHATGLNGDSEHRDFAPTPIIETSAIGRYYTSDNVLVPNSEYYRKIDDALFQPPFIVLKKGQQEKQITASYIDYLAYCKSGVFIMNKNDGFSHHIKKILVSFFNSDFAKYYLFLSASSWGIEREQIFFNEYLELPVFFHDPKNLSDIAGLFDELISELKQDFPDINSVEEKERHINRKLENAIGLTEKEQILIQDTLTFGLDLFEQGENSIGFRRILNSENEIYAKMICDELNDFYAETIHKVNVTVFDVRHYTPLNLIVLHFGYENKPVEIKNAMELMPLLSELNKHSIREKGKSIYVQKQFRYYDNDKIYLIKPNQKRYWTRSQAIEDATSLIIEITDMGEQG
jgi:hypothetical protein